MPSVAAESQSFIKKTFSEFSEDDCPTLAAALAYYTVFSLPSLLLIVVYVAGSVFGRAAVQGQLSEKIGNAVGPHVAAQLQTMISSAARSTTGGVIATIMGIAGLIFAATGTLVQLQTSLNRAWEVKADESGMKSFASKRIYSFLLIVGLSILVLVSLAAGSAISALTRSTGLPVPGILLYVAENVISFIVFYFLFGVVFKVLPDARIGWKDIKVGAAITAALFVIGKFLIGLYLAHSSMASAYGAAGALALLLLWTYYSAMVFLLGAEATQVWAKQHGRSVQPSEGAVKVRQEEERREEEKQQQEDRPRDRRVA